MIMTEEKIIPAVGQMKLLPGGRHIAVRVSHRMMFSEIDAAYSEQAATILNKLKAGDLTDAKAVRLLWDLQNGARLARRKAKLAPYK
jgi:hypothetical protein